MTLADSADNLNAILVSMPHVLFSAIIISFLLVFISKIYPIIKKYLKYKINFIKSNKILKLENSFESVINNINLIEIQIQNNNELLKEPIFSKKLPLINEQLKLKHFEFNEVLTKVKNLIK